MHENIMCKIVKGLSMLFSSSYYFIFLTSKYCFSSLFLNTFNICSSSTDQASHLYKHNAKLQFCNFNILLDPILGEEGSYFRASLSGYL
jgi:hypothetical protein